MKIIAYGSLMNQASLESMVNRPAPLSKIVIPGWRRAFDAAFDPYAFMNLKPAPDRVIEAAYFELDPAEAELFDEREEGSELVEVIPGHYAFVWPEPKCRELTVLWSYIDFCARAAAELGVNFDIDWPPDVEDDSANPRYPWT